MSLICVILAVVQTDFAPLHHIHQTTGCGHQQVTASLQITNLLTDISSTIHHTRPHMRAIGKLGKKGALERLERAFIVFELGCSTDTLSHIKWFLTFLASS